MITTTVRPLVVSMMQALGDAVYQRPALRAQSAIRDVYVDSCWPETYKDLPRVHCMRPVPMYRPGARNIAELDAFPWAPAPVGPVDRARFFYVLVNPDLTIARELERRVALVSQPYVCDLPSFGPAPYAQRYAVVRPVSVRGEWLNLARNPHPDYVAHAAAELRRRGYLVVCVGDLGDDETMLGPLPDADVYLLGGELRQPELFRLIEHAACVVGGVGWIVPTVLAYRTPAVIIGGGQGWHNAPARLVDPRVVDPTVRFVLPDDYCMCRAPRHACTKTIAHFPARFAAALDDATRVEAAA